MPQVPDPNAGWLPADQFILPRQELQASQIEEFLRHLFGDIARRPAQLRLREAAAVVRYLKLLCSQGVLTPAKEAADASGSEHSKDRWDANRIAEIIWNVLLQSGEFVTATKSEALDFLGKYRQTYLANPHFDRALAYVERFELPAGSRNPQEAPTFKSRSRTARIYPPNSRLKDDLSERIYVADRALIRAGLKTKRRPVIADALQAAGIGRRASGETIWTAEDVSDRVKEYVRAQQKWFAKLKVSWNGEGVVDQRISFFKFVQAKKRGDVEE
jgi:hypothetical protein